MEYIERNPAKCFSMPSLIGRRVTVYDVVIQVFLEENLDNVKEVQRINNAQIKAALRYCSSLSCKTDNEDYQFCDGCILRNIADGNNFDRNDYFEITHEDDSKLTISKIDGLRYMGSLDELGKEEIGKEMWVISQSLLKRYQSQL
jgi:uncharacterized protein (DUF433 family)